VLLEMQVFWDVTQGCQEINAQHFEGPSSLHLQDEVVHEHWQWRCSDPLKLLELLIQWQCHIPENSDL
jgi:hypothetical protein